MNICEITRTDKKIPTNNGKLFVRDVLPESHRDTSFLLFVHGLTFPSIADFDLPLQNHSIAEYFASRGISSCMFDSRGYGLSENSSTSDSVGLASRAEDLFAIYNHIREHWPSKDIILVGLSSGCNTIVECVKEYAIQPTKIVFLGPCFIKNKFLQQKGAVLPLLHLKNAVTGRPGVDYALFSPRSLRKRLHTERMLKSVCELFITTSLELSGNNGKVQAPIIPFLHFCNQFDMGDPLFDPHHLTVPTLLVRGETDEICCDSSLKKLYNAILKKNPFVQYKVFPDRAHDMHLFPDCAEVFDSIYSFVISN